MAIDISVIVPCYNQERYLANCLESLLRQSYARERYEIILVDNGSADRSAAIARSYAGIVVVEEAKRGSYAARNAGVRRASGGILAFTDSDCEVAAGWLERITQVLADQSIAVVQGSRSFARESLLLSVLADYENEKARYVFAGIDPKLYYAYTNNMAVQRQVYERCGPFEELARGADVIFMNRAVEAYSCAAVRYVPEMPVRHLEIDRWYSWHQKMWTYGKSYSMYRQFGPARSLGFRDRWQIMRQTVHRHRYSWARAALLLLTGIGAGLAFEAGVIVAACQGFWEHGNTQKKFGTRKHTE